MTKIYGASDDLIEIDGDVSDEVNIINAKNVSIRCSDGTSAKISYDGLWRIKMVSVGPMFKSLILAVGDDVNHTDKLAKDCPGYSDVLIINDGIFSVKIGRKTFTA